MPIIYMGIHCAAEGCRRWPQKARKPDGSISRAYCERCQPVDWQPAL